MQKCGYKVNRYFIAYITYSGCGFLPKALSKLIEKGVK
jgi:hypothetical protein